MRVSHVFGAFTLDVQDNGVGLLTFSRPPVNAVSLSVYEEIGRFADHVAADRTIRVIVITAPDDARAWCGGADLHEFKGMTAEKRKERYQFINAQLPRFHHIDRPMIAAIRGATVGVGVMLAGMCDLRIAAEDARFACPEVDYGLVGGSAGLFASLRMPEAKVREMLYTGRTFTARELESTGFFNYVVPAPAVLPIAMDLANQMARKSMSTLRARKLASLTWEGSEWMDAYLEAQEVSSALVENPESEAAVLAALERGRRRTQR
ncbi:MULTISPECIES: enoyl-CoA hydratase/isomerase family protein [Sphingobium]|uniref:Enoyl-CoA hydratase n=2 Tax=Sphingobium cupriresistens TaxID=1132417 RepID=A0A0J7Y1F2_9SPHN|nr:MULTISPECIES: enoyl-CoA hydratase/isomerase family protein [Sphingobium]KMS57751.1 enoyl-CoA hydratase [Sphingobium cupriresistens LL01]MBJ7377985.1 enoyl-CoA hydratase/isomerase family protein [Sphingobium sp.]RYM10845.1 enoyl-CoA hydratase/isomerase family protein [Sphingobium cupriresistens]WCP14848.1 1,4-dihydroxy-2-naphthoyl-CoA synthase [Sphingobium sp. AntQ-1]